MSRNYYKIRREISKKIPDEIDESLNIFGLFKKERDPELYDTQLKLFHHVFSLGEEAKIYLWNSCCTILDDNSYSPSKFDREDFSQEELDFFNEIEKTKQYDKNRWKTTKGRININSPIETERLKLVPYNQQLSKEYDDYFYNNKEEYEGYYGCDYDIDFVENTIETHPLSFCVLLKDINQIIGVVELYDINGAQYNVSYHIRKEYRKKGYAYEALNTLIEKIKSKELKVLAETVKEYVFEEISPDIRCLRIQTGVNNFASQALAKKLGFEKLGIELFASCYGNTYYDDVLYYMIINNDRKAN